MTEIPNQSFRMPASDAKNYLEQASALIKIGNFQEAIPLFESALATLERTNGGDQPEIAEYLQELGESYEAVYRLGDALRIHTRLLRLGEKVLGKTNPNVVAMQFKLCQINELLGNPADALACCQSALDSAKQCLAQDDPLSQQIIDRYRFLSSLALAQQAQQPQIQMQQPQVQTQAPQVMIQPDLLQSLPQTSPSMPESPHFQDTMPSQFQDLEQFKQSLQNAPQIQNPDQMLNPSFPDSPSFQDNSAFQNPAAQTWQSEHTGSALDSSEIVGQSSNAFVNASDNASGNVPSMQDFAREMLRDMPGSPIFDQQMPSGQPINFNNVSNVSNAAPDMVAPTVSAQPGGHTDSSVGYKSLLEAGFSAAQNAAINAVQNAAQTTPQIPAPSQIPSTAQYRIPNDPHAGVAGSAPPPPPAYEPGGEGYSLSDLDDIRAGRRPTSEMYTEIKPSRPRRISQDESKKIEVARLAKLLAFPAAGALTLIVVLIFVTLGNHGEAPKSGTNPPETTKPASFGMYRTADGTKEIRFTSASEVVFATAGSAISIPYTLIENNFGALVSAIATSGFEKQIWIEKRDIGLKTQDEIPFYAGDSAETKVMSKMRRLGGAVQAYFLKHGEYPRYQPAAMAADFAFVNPLTGRGAPIPIRTLLSQTSDASDARSGLESGLEIGLAPGSESLTTIHNPFAITCYAVIIGSPTDDLERMRATKFFVRACDRDGNFLGSGQAGRSFVVGADNSLLAAVTSTSTSTASASTKTKVKSKTKAATKQSAASGNSKSSGDTDSPKTEQSDSTPSPLSILQVEPPSKNTKMWLIVQPPLPMLLFHHALPLILLGLAVLAFLRSRMVQDDPTGTSISSNRDMVAHYAQIIACVFLGLAFITIVAQFLVFS